MKTIPKYLSIPVISLSVLLTGCNDNDDMFKLDSAESIRISLAASIMQANQSRVNDSGFCNGDAVGIYIVDYNGSTPGELKAEGNHADNVRHIFDETAYQWNASHDLYFTDKNTNIDIYGYYPLASPDNISAYSFELRKDQSTSAAEGAIGGYEASDFLWGSAKNVSPTDKVIRLGFNHIMASSRVSLVEGSGFSDGEWTTLDKSVLMLNTVRTSTINLATGEVTPVGNVPSTGTIPYEHNGDYRAIIVPQTVPAGTPLVSVTIGGTPYLLKKTEAFTYVPSKMHNFTITVNKRQGSGYEFVLASESITPWENDNVSHDAIAREYIVIDVQNPGTLKECIENAGKDITQVRNLKLTGKISAKDFKVMKEEMTILTALNLKEVECERDEIPNSALSQKESLTSLVLPDKLKRIGEASFEDCFNLSGSLIIPEGVIEIGDVAFSDCISLTGTLSLPSTLKQIGTVNYKNGRGAFFQCNFVCELVLPESLETIGRCTFSGCKNLYGQLRLPDNLKELGEGAFSGCEGFSGSLTIPQQVTNIPKGCFNGCWFGGVLSLHDGITTIGESAFANTGMNGELRLPKNLEVLSNQVFYNCDFSGELVLPETLRTIGDKCFAYNWRLMGTIEIPEGVLSIGAGAFAQCRSIEGVIFPESLESIRFNTNFNDDGGAFQNCFGIGRIVCKGTIPAYVQDGAFHGVAKDNFTLEVPESAIAQYQAAAGWRDFKRISAYRNLVIRPSMATAINTSVTRNLVLNADEEWEVISQPEWVRLDKTSGYQKSEIKLTFDAMPHGAPIREGEVVFKLKGKDYTTTCKVSQYNYQYDEDEILTLQKATRGNGVNIVLLGDGYNAKDISEGKLLANINEAVEHFFNIEPYKTYRDYFNVYTGIAVSPESGIGSVNTIIYNRFNTTAKLGVTLGGRNGESDYNDIFRYACKAPTVSDANLNQTLIIMIPNTTEYGGICYMYDEGAAIAYCPMSTYGYPLDFRGVIQHEAGGHGFGKLGDEYIYHNMFIDACPCTCCAHDFEFRLAKAKGWYANLSLTGKMNEVPWSHLIFHEKYNQIVDVYEGGFMHNRGVYRSEQNSCMNNDIPYYSTISREEIVKRIKAIAGEPYSFADFVANDVLDAAIVSRSKDLQTTTVPSATINHHNPVFMGKRHKL